MTTIMARGIMKLKEFRKKYNLSQTDLAKIMKTSQKTISNYENGVTDPDLSSLISLADYFHTTVDHIIGHEVPYLINKSLFSDVQLEIIEKLKTLDNDQSKRILSYIDGIKSEQKR